MGVLLGLGLAFSGSGVGLLLVGVLLIGDCSAECEARGERTWAILVAAAAFVVSIVGLFIFRRSVQRLRRGLQGP